MEASGADESVVKSHRWTEMVSFFSPCGQVVTKVGTTVSVVVRRTAKSPSQTEEPLSNLKEVLSVEIV